MLHYILHCAIIIVDSSMVTQLQKIEQNLHQQNFTTYQRQLSWWVWKCVTKSDLIVSSTTTQNIHQQNFTTYEGSCLVLGVELQSKLNRTNCKVASCLARCGTVRQMTIGQARASLSVLQLGVFLISYIGFFLIILSFFEK